MLVRVSCMEVCWFASTRSMNNARTAVCQALFRRAISVRGAGVSHGHLQNLMATDAEKLGNEAWVVFGFAQWSYAVVSLPYVVYSLYRLIGFGAAVAAMIMVAAALFNKNVARCMQPVVRRVQQRRDERAGIVAELVRGARTVKVLGW